jgi:hypothetical protein
LNELVPFDPSRVQIVGLDSTDAGAASASSALPNQRSTTVQRVLCIIVDTRQTGRRDLVQTYQIHVAGARDRVHAIRTELFVFPEILEVFVTGNPNSLVVVCAGRPRPGDWMRAIRTLGYEVLARRRPTTTAFDVDLTHKAGTPENIPGCSPAAARRRRPRTTKQAGRVMTTESAAGHE